MLIPHPVERATANDCEFVSIPEWCRRVGCSLTAATGRLDVTTSPECFASVDWCGSTGTHF
jgi:hypothetical protein